MKKLFFRRSLIKMALPVVALFILFLLTASDVSAQTFLSPTAVSAQTFVNTTEAVIRLKNQMVSISNDLVTLKLTDAETNTLQATHTYYGALVTFIGSGTAIDKALVDAMGNVCYPTDKMDCQLLEKAATAAVVDKTVILLSN